MQGTKAFLRCRADSVNCDEVIVLSIADQNVPPSIAFDSCQLGSNVEQLRCVDFMPSEGVYQFQQRHAPGWLMRIATFTGYNYFGSLACFQILAEGGLTLSHGL